MLKWLEKNNDCPLCRHKLPAEPRPAPTLSLPFSVSLGPFSVHAQPLPMGMLGSFAALGAGVDGPLGRAFPIDLTGFGGGADLTGMAMALPLGPFQTGRGGVGPGGGGGRGSRGGGRGGRGAGRGGAGAHPLDPLGLIEAIFGATMGALPELLGPMHVGLPVGSSAGVYFHLLSSSPSFCLIHLSLFFILHRYTLSHSLHVSLTLHSLSLSTPLSL